MRRYVPNLLSLYRVVVAPAVCLLVSKGHWVAALVLLMAAFATDLADGYLARRWNVASSPDGFGKQLDVFGDRTIIIAPILGMVIAGNLGQVGVLLLPLWVAIMYSTDWLFPRQVDFANFVVWTIGYILTAWQAFEYLSSAIWLVFAAVTLAFIALGGLNHAELVSRGFKQASIKR